MPKLRHYNANFTIFTIILASSLLFTTNLKAGEISGTVRINSEDGKNITAKSRVVVYLTGKNLTQKKLLDPAPIVLQKGKLFEPRVLAVTQGQEVIFKNADPVHHNVWSLSKAKSFDLGTFKSPEQKNVTFDKPGLIKTFCNIHPGMIGSVLVLKNSFHSTSDKNGKYSIKNIPAGEYTARVWAEGASPQKKKVIVTKNGKFGHDWVIGQKLRSEKHLNKNGKPYKKY